MRVYCEGQRISRGIRHHVDGCLRLSPRSEFLQAVATKVINIFSSLVAAAIFAIRGVVDYRLGIILGLTMFVGAIVGRHIAMRLSAVWLRRIFVVAVIGLAVKMVFSLLK
jgi:uncharacterized membrane protein YfcA